MRARAGAPRVGREGFELGEDVVWLDTAHQGPLPRKAAKALQRAASWKSDPSRLPEEAFFEAPERLRSALATLMDRPPAEIVIGNSASYGLDLLQRGLELGEGDEILLIRDDFPATVVPWLPLAERGVRIRWLPRRSAVEPGIVAAALRPETRLFCCTWVDSFSGAVLDAEAVGRVCRDAGVLFVLNATQGLGVRRLDLGRVAADAVTCAGYKWLCGPYGTGFCWISTPLMDRLRTGRRYWLPAARRHGLRNLGAVVAAAPPAGAPAHDVFCAAAFFNVLPWIAALDFLAGIGAEAVAEHNRSLVAAVREVLAASGLGDGWTQAGRDESPFVVVKPPGGRDACRVVAELRDQGVHVALRSAGIRISPHVHNEPGDVARLASALATALG